LFDALGRRTTGVSCGASITGFTFDNSAGLGSTTLPLPIISTLSAAGAHGAFISADGLEVGSPGTTSADVTPPTIDPHADVVVSAVDASGSIATYTLPAAHDNVDVGVAVTCAPASGELFPLGLTPVNCQASDAAGNAAATVTFTVRVIDTTPPVLAPLANIDVDDRHVGSGDIRTVGDRQRQRAGEYRGVMPARVRAAFPIGTTPVSCAARDGQGMCRRRRSRLR
jgi:hypothetical protein